MDAAPLRPHEVLPRELAVVPVDGGLAVQGASQGVGVDGGAATALEPCTIPGVGVGEEAAGWTGAVRGSGGTRTRQDTTTEE